MGLKVAELFAEFGIHPDKESFDVGERLLDKLKEGLEVVAGFEGVKKLYELVEGTEETAVAAERLAQKVGVTTNAVQELGYAAKVAGVSAEELQIGFVFLARGIEKFEREGSGPAAKAFQQLGISARQLKGESLDQNLELIATKFAAMKDGAEKTALAMEIFGRSGANLIPLLNKGQAGIVELRNEAHKLGIVIDESSIKKFKELEETQNRISGAWQGIKIQLAEALLPTISKVADELFKWIEANKDLIAHTLERVISATVTVAEALGAAIAFVTDAISFLSDNSNLAKSILVGLAGAFLAVKGEAVESGIATAIAWIAATAEFLLTAAAMALLAYGLYELFDNAQEVGDGIANVFLETGEFIVETFESVWEQAVEIFDDLADGITSVFWGVVDNVRDAFVVMLNWIIDKINWVTDKLGWLANKVSFGAIDSDSLSIGHIGTALSPTGGFNPGGAGVGAVGSIHQENHNTVTIHAQNADAEEVGRIVRKELDDQHRQAAASLGTGAH